MHRPQRPASLISIQGFSLIELMIVTAIIGLMGQLTAYSLVGNMPRYRLHGAAQQVAWDLMAARMQAIKRSQNVIVTFTGKHQYKVGADLNNNAILDSGEGETKDLHQKKNYGVSFSTPLPPSVMFYPGGNPNALANLVLSNAHGSKSVVIKSTGKVKIN